MRFLVKAFDSEAVAYDSASGDTHYLPPLAFAILEIMQSEEGGSTPDLRGQLAARFAVPPGSIRDDEIAEALDRMHAVGLLPAS